MTQRKGRCTNFGNCGTADTKQTIELPETADFVCPGCSKQLTEIASAGKSRFSPLAIGLFILAIAVVGLFELWPKKNQEAGPVAAKSAAIIPIVILRLHGSNTIGAQLAPALAEGFLKAQGATDIRVVSGKKEETAVQAVLPGDSALKIIAIEAHGTATGFKDLAQSHCDIAMASRKINSEELTGLSALGDMTLPASEHVLGVDGIAVIVNPSNPIQSLTKTQLANIFTGAIRSWTQVLSPKGAIRVYARDDKSGTYDVFKSLVLAPGTLVGSAVRFEDSRALSDKVANDPDGIGFIGLPYVLSAKAIALSEGGSRPLLPNRMTVATEDYLLARRLYLYTAANPSNTLVPTFISYALSKSGQEVVADNGFVAQNVQAEPVAVASDSPSDYKRLTNGADRMSLDFRFRTGSAGLDNKAIADLDRVITFVTDVKFTGQNVMLIGFADSTGDAARNVALSKSRAKAVAEQFAPRGLTPSVITGFGAALPVASNDTDEGRQKNRRVEIWLRK